MPKVPSAIMALVIKKTKQKAKDDPVMDNKEMNDEEDQMETEGEDNFNMEAKKVAAEDFLAAIDSKDPEALIQAFMALKDCCE